VITILPQSETKFPIISYDDGKFKKIDDTIVTEYALTIKLNGEEFATLVCTPEYLEDMVMGFLASEHVIKSILDIEDLWIEQSRGLAHVKVKETNQLYEKFRSKRYVTSCCGMSRQGFYFINDALTAKKLHYVKVSLTPTESISLMESLQLQATTFKRTGGVHNAGLCDTKRMLLSRMDIGRHNALDKLYGYCLRYSIPLENKILVFSGRVSSEILIKASKIGCAIVLSKSAPTELALEIADKLGITTVGFIRNKSFNIYTHSWRIQQD
jgi:FdhD protein